MPKKFVLLTASLTIAFAGLVFAAGFSEEYKVHGSRAAEVVTDGSAGESTDLATLLSDRAKQTQGNPTIVVSAEFSNAAATAALTCVLLDGSGALMGVQTSTATAGSYRTAAAGDYVAPLVFFDTCGAPRYEIRHAAVSAGSVDLRVWTCGSQRP